MKRFTKIITLALLSFTVLSLFSCTPVDDGSTVFTDTLAEWTVSDDGQKLYRNGEMLALVQRSKRVKLDPAYRCEYATSVNIPYNNIGAVTLYSYDLEGNFVWAVAKDGRTLFYANQAGTNALLSPPDKDAPFFYLMESGNHRASLEKETLSALDERLRDEKDLATFKATFLKDLPCYTIAAYDETHSLRCDYGAIYLYDDEYYYLNYLNIEDGLFHENGSFTYLRGSVNLTRLDGKLTKRVEDLLDETSPFYPDSAYERVATNGSGSPERISAGFFWVSFIVFGFLCPIPFLVMGFAFPQSERRGSPRYWYAVAVAASVWLLASFMLLLLLL